MSMPDKIGPTGNFPDGKLDDTDIGEIAIALSIRGKSVVMHFGTKLTWFGMDSKTAKDIGNKLLELAEKIP